MDEIPEYLEIDDSQQFERWKSYVLAVRSFGSKYLTSDDRKMMLLSFYQSERGYGASDSELSSERLYDPFIKKVQDNLSQFALSKEKNYDWKFFLTHFGEREQAADFANYVARDLYMLEVAIQKYKELKNSQIKFDQKYDNNLDKESMKIARFLDDVDNQNYIV